MSPFLFCACLTLFLPSSQQAHWKQSHMHETHGAVNIWIPWSLHTCCLYGFASSFLRALLDLRIFPSIFLTSHWKVAAVVELLKYFVLYEKLWIWTCWISVELQRFNLQVLQLPANFVAAFHIIAGLFPRTSYVIWYRWLQGKWRKC